MENSTEIIKKSNKKENQDFFRGVGGGLFS